VPSLVRAQVREVETSRPRLGTSVSHGTAAHKENTKDIVIDDRVPAFVWGWGGLSSI